MTDIYMSTVCLEKNRWQKPKKFSSYKVSDWVDRFKQDGFNGLELWEHHALQADEDELLAQKNGSIPVVIYNSYVKFGNHFEEERKKAADMIAKLDAKGVKFNLGNDPTLRHMYVENLKTWACQVPDSCQLICECHPGTIMEDPKVAEEVFNELGSDRYRAIVHPFHSDDSKDLQIWFDYLGSTVSHAHSSIHRDMKFHKLETKKDLVQKNIQLMQDAGFSGTFSLEFTGGVGTPDETMEEVYRSAVDDLNVLKKFL